MNETELLDFLFSKRLKKRRSDLQESFNISLKLQSPQKSYPIVHVAGTNGKGSVCLKIATALTKAGLKVGLFTSPHLESFTERIMINQQAICSKKAMMYLSQLLEISQDLNFFEYITLMSLSYFRDEKVDVAVIEVGVGGLLDPTNIVTPILSVITSIAKDHESILGSQLEQIAFQKAGIIKPHIPVVIGPKADFVAIRQRAKLCNSFLYHVKENNLFYDHENSAIAKKALNILQSHFCLLESHIEEGIQARPSCRFERKGQFILDVAHNPNGFERLLEAYDYFFPKQSFQAIIGMSNDKDVATCLKLISSRASKLYLVDTFHFRATCCHQMAEILKGYSYFNFYESHTISKALQQALSLSKDMNILVCGSFYLMQEANQRIFSI